MLGKRTAHGIFVPKNPQKYRGTNADNITYRSSWEHTFMNMCDAHPNIVQWSSECISVPYRNPLTGRWSMYVPDFLIVYIDKKGQHHSEMIEIKPLKETPLFEGKVGKQVKISQAINQAKWTAALQFCVKRGIKFRVMTENDLFGYKRKTK
jgi:hypothetical protein